jgi:hypothetical protein
MHRRIGFAHFVGDPYHGVNRYERALPNAWTMSRGLPPRRARTDQFRPEGKGAALSGLGGVDCTTSFQEKLALRIPRLAQAKQVFRPVYVFRLKLFRSHTDECCRVPQVMFCDVDKTRLPAATGTVRLANESKPLHGS